MKFKRKCDHKKRNEKNTDEIHFYRLPMKGKINKLENNRDEIDVNQQNNHKNR